ncbi:MAG: lysine--tRNA ligase [Candidatus Marinimicrobia bacterium]|nr:lysine--tRNA ligase [Candidatus Neomarinimicrobiota bacterium]|tara:strand:- start:583 stop:2067 length:1485 start_codon:yes stop_codon:yes gene_type:complete
MKQQNKSLKQIINHRIEKLKKLKSDGIDPYPPNFNPTNNSDEIKSDFSQFEDKTVCIAGRIMSIRKMGKASFCQLTDSKGLIQFFIRKDNVGDDMYNHFKLLDIGDFVGIEGVVFKTKTKEITLNVSDLTILSKSIRPLPIVKEKDGKIFDQFSDKEQRYRNRHLDLIVNPDIKKTFVKRALIIKSIRTFLDNLGFLEVETPILQPIYGGANAKPFKTYHNALDQNLYLRIADELYLKRLIIGGFDRVYEISKDFRNEGMDRNHNPEFTMLEFYWAYSDFIDNMKIVEDLIRETAKNVDSLIINVGDDTIDLSKPFDKRSFFELLEEALGYDLSKLTDNELEKICKNNGIELDQNTNAGKMLDELMSKFVEPSLIKPTFIVDYPKILSPLAKKHRNSDPDLVERFELFIGGTEFANAFTELNDPIDQRERLEQQAAFRDLGDEEAQIVDENFIQAVECGMPPTGGVGIGIDRLTMLLTSNRWIKDVILFPAMRQ